METHHDYLQRTREKQDIEKILTSLLIPRRGAEGYCEACYALAKMVLAMTGADMMN